MGIFALVIANLETLQCIPYIQYLIQFQNNKVKALIDSDSKINIVTPTYVVEHGLIIQKTSVKAQKTDGLPLETYNMVSTRFLIQNSLEKVRFFEPTFLLANTSIEVVLEMLFLSLNNADIKFAELKKLT